MSFVLPSGESHFREVAARWSRDGDRCILSWEGAGTTEAAVQGDSLTMINEGQVLVYRRSP